MLTILTSFCVSLPLLLLCGHLWNALCYPEIIRDDNGDAYLIRYFIWKPKNSKRYGRIYLHHIMRSDHDHALHSHPWNFKSFLIKGGYWEHADVRQISACDFIDGWKHTPALGQAKKFFKPGSLLIRGAGWRHRLELPTGKTAWSLVFTSPKVCEWGFFPNGYFCHHTKYDTLTGLCNED